MSYLAAAYAVFWGLAFVYVFSIANRQRSLAREVEALERALSSQDEGE
jgi:CcmD family protein